MCLILALTEIKSWNETPQMMEWGGGGGGVSHAQGMKTGAYMGACACGNVADHEHNIFTKN